MDIERNRSPLYGSASSGSPAQVFRVRTAAADFVGWLHALEPAYNTDTAVVLGRARELFWPDLGDWRSPSDAWGRDASPNFWCLVWLPPTCSVTLCIAHYLAEGTNVHTQHVLSSAVSVACLTFILPVAFAVAVALCARQGPGPAFFLAGVTSTSALTLPAFILLCGLLPLVAFQLLFAVIAPLLSALFVYRASVHHLVALDRCQASAVAASWGALLLALCTFLLSACLAGI